MFIDQLGRKTGLSSPPKRIISLVPSQTELLFYLGLRDEVVGITKFCIYPTEWFRTKTRVGGTKKIDFEKIKQLNPDLIIGNKEENDKEQIEQLMKEYNVWMSDIYTLNDALDMILGIGTLVNREEEAVSLKLSIKSAFEQFEQKTIRYFSTRDLSKLSSTEAIKSPTIKGSTVAYFIWKDPFMAVGNNTFINDMLCRCGLTNVFESNSRYPEITPQVLAEKKPEIILLSSEPYPFKEKHIYEFQSICPAAKIMIVEGELFSWYGSRLLQAPAYFEKLFIK